jgi:hypothetical protein
MAQLQVQSTGGSWEFYLHNPHCMPCLSYHTSKAQCHKASKPVLAVVKVSSSSVARAALSPSILYLDAARHFPYGLQAYQPQPLSLPQQIREQHLRGLDGYMLPGSTWKGLGVPVALDCGVPMNSNYKVRVSGSYRGALCPCRRSPVLAALRF